MDKTSTAASFCRPKWPDAKVLKGELICEKCGLSTDNGWHDGQTIDIQVFCPRCGREIAVLSGDAHLEGFEASWMRPREWLDGYVSDLVLGHDWIGKEIKGNRHSVELPDLMRMSSEERQRVDPGTTRKYVLVCPDERRCRYRRVVGYPRASAAMIKAWRKGSHKVIAGLDL